MPYLAKQRIGFGQLTWDKENNHDLLLGLLRYQYYDDNTTATVKKILIGFSLFVQDEIT
jgi:outer membrane receptor for ferrienterochelin and colicins